MITRELQIACDIITESETGQYLTQEGQPYDAVNYSKLKYGSLLQARTMGRRLGEKVLEVAPDLALGDEPPEAIAVYKSVPPACHALARFCIDRINQDRISEGLEPGTVLKVKKRTEVTGDYASASPEERQAMLNAIGLDTDGHSFDGKTVMYVDDIRVTGGAERHTRSAIDKFSPAAVIFGYISLFNEAEGKADSAVEYRINHEYVKGLPDITRIINEEGFILNVRVLRRLLSSLEDNNREEFLDGIDDALLYDFYSGALSWGPEFLTDPNFTRGFTELSAHAKSRKLI